MVSTVIPSYRLACLSVRRACLIACQLAKQFWSGRPAAPTTGRLPLMIHKFYLSWVVQPIHVRPGIPDSSTMLSKYSQ